MSYDPEQEKNAEQPANPERPVSPEYPAAAQYPPAAPYPPAAQYPPAAPYPPVNPYQQGGYEVPPVQPLPLGEAIRELPGQYLRALTRPGPRFFAAEEGKSAWNIIWIQLIFISVVSAILIFLIFAFTLPTTISSFNLQTTPSSANATSQIVQLYKNLALPGSIAILFLTPLSYFINVGLFFLIAKLFKGQGTFVRYFYSYQLFSVPLSIIMYLLYLIPFAGSYLSFIVSIYHIVLFVFMTMAVHRMSGGRATLAVLLLPIIVFVLAIIGGIIFAVVIINSMRIH